MKLMLRPEWRLWPLSSFLGFLDLKTGVTVALIFTLLNKVAGVYGLIAVLTGAGGSFAQLSLYVYSVIALLALAWGLRAVKEEDPKQTLFFAHLFFADHIFSTSWTVFFAVVWWAYTPHDGRRQANSAAQQAMVATTNTTSHALTSEERKAAAMAIWNHEKGTAAGIVVVSWILKIYFSLLLYSYATHLRKGSYRALHLSRSMGLRNSITSNNAYDISFGLIDEEDEIEGLYHVPLRTHNAGNSSISSFADFASAPGRPRKTKSRLSQFNGGAFGGKLGPRNGDTRGTDERELMFDEDESTAYTSSSRPHSKLGTEESSTAGGTDDERENGRGSAGIEQ